MKNTAFTLFAIGALCATSATAQSLPDNMYIDGYVDITSFHTSGGFDETIGTASLDFGLTPNRENRFGVGFSLGLDAVGFDDVGLSEVALYPAVTFALGNTGLVSVGIPRPVLDYGYIPKDTLAHSEGLKLEIELGGVSHSLASWAYLYGPSVFSADVDMYGLRYDGEFGNTKVGASYHRISRTGASTDADVYSVAFQHQLGAIGSMADTKLFGGIERFDTGSSNATSYTLGVEANSEKLRTGLILSKNDGDSPVRASIANLYADYKITDRFSVAGSIYHFNRSGGSDFNMYGLGVEYQFLNGGYVNANYTEQDSSSSVAFYEVSLGWRF